MSARGHHHRPDPTSHQQEVVDLLRDRIRCNALELLSRADAATSDRTTRRRRSRTGSGGSGSGGSGTGVGIGTLKSAYELLSIDTTAALAAASSSSSTVSRREEESGRYRGHEEEEEKKDGETPRYGSYSLSSSSSAAATPTELTHRLQQLAAQRRRRDDQLAAAVALQVIQAGDTHLKGGSTFEELMLPPHLLRSVHEMGFNRPSEIQSATLPLIFGGRNVIAQAQSGSGKTVAFSLGVLYHVRVANDDENGGGNPPRTQAVILAPTRELAIQAWEQAVRPLASHVPGLAVQLAVSGSQPPGCSGPGAGGSSSTGHNKVRAHVVIGTPGKVTDWLKRRVLDVREVKVFVLDEADSMVDGFRAKTLQIYKQLPPRAQCLLFSATFPPLVVDFAARLVPNPDLVLVEDDEELVLEVIKQVWVDTREYPGGRIMFLADIYALMTIGQSIVFVETRDEADDVHATLGGAGYSVSVLHSHLEAAERDATMREFRSGASSVLITTNVLARGANVDNVCLVINYSLPTDRHGHGDCETYLHRIGRTGRFGRKGTAINLVDAESSLRVLEEIRDHFNAPMTHVAADPEALASEIQI